MIRPEYLKKGDQVLLVSPAGKLTKYDVYPAIKILEDWGLDVKIAPHVFASHHRFAGTDEQRLSDLQAALDDANIKAIYCTRGGYGSVRVLRKLKFNAFMKKPKWLVGFSDITVLHSYFNTILKCETIHAPMAINLSNDTASAVAVETLRKALFGEQLSYEVAPNPLNVYGKSEGILVGGNLANISSLLGAGIGYVMKKRILFIEDIGEPIHKIDQMLIALQFAGKLGAIRGLIVGGFTDINTEPNFGKSAYELIYDAIIPYGIPVLFGFPCGHIQENYALYIGRKISLSVEQELSRVSFE